MAKNEILKVENITKVYSKNGTKALDNVSFTLYDNEVTGLIGPNGAGKTTLMRLILGYEESNSGKITFLDEETTDLSIRDSIGYQSDNQYNSKSFTIYSYLRFHSELYNIQNIDDRIEQLLTRFSLLDAKKKKISALSKGMRQKLELALAFLNKPKLILLDEPTSALDPPSVFALRDYINEYKSSEATILFSSHNLTEVEKVCDRIIFIDRGQIISDIYTAETEDGFLESAFRKYETEGRFV